MATKDFVQCFAEVVRYHRKQIKMSQEKLAENANLSMRMISLVESNRRTPSIRVANSIAKGLSIPFWRLIKDTEDFRRDQATVSKRKK
jgi:transcriptional regulator with XRE-family HTH domain